MIIFTILCQLKLLKQSMVWKVNNQLSINKIYTIKIIHTKLRPCLSSSTAALIFGWWAAQTRFKLEQKFKQAKYSKSKTMWKEFQTIKTFTVRNVHHIMSTLLIEPDERAFRRAANRQFCAAPPSPLKAKDELYNVALNL